MGALEILRAIFGGIFLLVLPGLSWSFLFFKKREIAPIERIGISIGLSIAIVCLCLFLMNKALGFALNLLNCTILVLIVTVFPVIVAAIRARFKKTGGFPAKGGERKV